MPTLRTRGLERDATVTTHLKQAEVVLGNTISNEHFTLTRDGWLEVQGLPIPVVAFAMGEPREIETLFGEVARLTVEVADQMGRDIALKREVILSGP